MGPPLACTNICDNMQELNTPSANLSTVLGKIRALVISDSKLSMLLGVVWLSGGLSGCVIRASFVARTQPSPLVIIMFEVRLYHFILIFHFAELTLIP